MKAPRTSCTKDAGWAEAGVVAGISAPRALGQGFLCNITNPKVLAFNLAVLPQFLGVGAGLPLLLAYALALSAVGGLVLLIVVLGANAARRAISSRRARRGIDAAAGAVFLGFAAVIAAEA